jgi:hypothetical protein
MALTRRGHKKNGSFFAVRPNFYGPRNTRRQELFLSLRERATLVAAILRWEEEATAGDGRGKWKSLPARYHICSCFLVFCWICNCEDAAGMLHGAEAGCMRIEIRLWWRADLWYYCPPPLWPGAAQRLSILMVMVQIRTYILLLLVIFFCLFFLIILFFDFFCNARCISE